MNAEDQGKEDAKDAFDNADPQAEIEHARRLFTTKEEVAAYLMAYHKRYLNMLLDLLEE